MNTASHSPAQFTAEACAQCARRLGCSACFEELVRRFQSPLLHFLTRRGSSQHDAEDLVQETFLLAYRNLDKYHDRWKFSTWLFTIAHRQALSSKRKRPQPINSQTALDAPKRTINPLTNAEETEFRGKLWNAAQSILEPDAFTALWLSYVESMPADEIGQVLGRNANAVRILMHRARTKLSEQLSTELQPPGAGK
jgi:RNA polymerase sigma-70 factor (ECF subfamily)